VAKNSFFSRLDNAVQSFKMNPQYARLSDGTHTYSIETERFGFLSDFGLGTPFYSPKENLKGYYKSVFFLQDCINLYADIATQVRIKEVDKRGNEVKDSPFLDLLEKPNPFQTRKELITEMVINTLTTGGSFQYGNFFDKANLGLSASLWNLEYNTLAFPKIKNRYVLNEKSLGSLDVIEKLEASDGSRRINLSEIAMFYDNIPHSGHGEHGFDGKHFFTPMSRIFALLSSLHTLLDSQNTMAYLAGHNVNKVLYKKYHDGVVAPLASDEKQDIEKKVSGRGKYGSMKGKAGDVIASNEDLGVLDLTRDNKKLQMTPLQENAKENVRNAYLIPKDYFGDSTYENKQFSEARFTLGPVKSLTDGWLGSLNGRAEAYFKARGTKLVGTYDHMPSVIETKTTLSNRGFHDRAEALSLIIDTFSKLQAIEPTISWEDFLTRHQFTDFLQINAQ